VQMNRIALLCEGEDATVQVLHVKTARPRTSPLRLRSF